MSKINILYELVFCCLLTLSVSLRLAAMEEQKPIVYISLEGGGMHMCAALEVLQRLEKENNRPIAELVDGIIGLSSGAIIGAHLLSPTEPKWSAKNLKDNLPQMLDEAAKGSAIGGMLSSLFSNFSSFKTLFMNSIGPAPMQNACGHLLMAAYNTETHVAKIFDSHEESDANIPIWNITQASASISARAGIEWAWGATVIQYDANNFSSGWVDGGMAPQEQKKPIYETLANKLKDIYPDRQIYIYSFSGGPDTFKGYTGAQSHVQEWQDENISIIRFMPMYSDIPESNFLGISTWYQMLLNTSLENIDNIDSHFFTDELEHNEAYINMFKLIAARFE